MRNGCCHHVFLIVCLPVCFDAVKEQNTTGKGCATPLQTRFKDDCIKLSGLSHCTKVYGLSRCLLWHTRYVNFHLENGVLLCRMPNLKE